jgi:hypothetical protein
MNPERLTDEALSTLLREWKVEAPLPPGFQEQVWRTIDRGEARESLWALTLRRLTEALARPSLATSYVTVLLLIGLGAGYWQARSANAQAEESLSARYVQMIDPYQMPGHR